MTRILRSVGDTTTTAPDSYRAGCSGVSAEQVRFMAALGNGQVVSREASAFLLQEMQPIPAQRWGLGAIGARAFKPGWVNAQTETRQMGIVGDYAVAIITAGDGPADAPRRRRLCTRVAVEPPCPATGRADRGLELFDVAGVGDSTRRPVSSWIMVATSRNLSSC